MLRPFSCPKTRRLLSFIACISPVLTYAQTNSIDELKTVRSNLSQALEYRDQAAKEQFAWELRKEEMENLLMLASEEQKNLEAAVALARPILEDLQSQNAEITSDEEESKALAEFLKTAGPSLARKVISSSEKWPELLLQETRGPLQDIQIKLDQDPQSLSNDAMEALVKSSVEALEAALEFQNKVHHSALLKTLPDGREALFDVVFLGLANGYYVSNELQLAGKIVMQNGEWEWIPQDDLLGPVQSFIDISNEALPATWVELPVATSKGGSAQ
jgi:hypothetical protein